MSSLANESPPTSYDIDSYLLQDTTELLNNSTQAELGDHNFVALLILPILCVIGLIGNVLVCIAIWTDRRLHNVTNYFLFSLALADLLVCMVVMPLAILVEVKQGVWIWSFGLCLLYTYADVFLCSASIVHISVISLDRYLGISRPLKLRNRSRTIVALKICFVWIMTIVISCPLAVLAVIEPETILQENACTIRSRQYMIYGSTLSFLIPFIIMTITFTKTAKLLNNQANALSKKSTENSSGNNGLRRTVMQHKKLVYTRTNSHNNVLVQGRTPPAKRSTNGVTSPVSPLVKYQSTSVDQAITTIDDDKDSAFKQSHFNNTSTDIEDDSILHVKRTSVSERLASEPTGLYMSSPQELKGHLQRSSTRIRSQLNRVRAQLVTIARRKRRKLESTNVELANEHKATRVLAVVFACFFTCWTPFFVTNFTLGFCGDQCAVPAWLSSVILWLGYLSSTLNPVIYTTFNRRFREAFLRIIRCQCLGSRGGNYNRSHVFLTGDATWTCIDKSALYHNNRESSALVIQNGSPKSPWKSYSINKRLSPDKDKVRVIASKVVQSSENLSTNKRSEVPGMLLPKPITIFKQNRNGRSLEKLPQTSDSARLDPFGQAEEMFPLNRRFSAATSIFPSLEPKRLCNAEKFGILRSTPVLTILDYDEEQNECSKFAGTTSKKNTIMNLCQKISFTISESIPNIDDDSEESEISGLLTPTVIDRSQAQNLLFPHFD